MQENVLLLPLGLHPCYTALFGPCSCFYRLHLSLLQESKANRKRERNKKIIERLLGTAFGSVLEEVEALRE